MVEVRTQNLRSVDRWFWVKPGPGVEEVKHFGNDEAQKLEEKIRAEINSGGGIYLIGSLIGSLENEIGHAIYFLQKNQLEVASTSFLKKERLVKEPVTVGLFGWDGKLFGKLQSRQSLLCSFQVFGVMARQKDGFRILVDLAPAQRK